MPKVSFSQPKPLSRCLDYRLTRAAGLLFRMSRFPCHFLQPSCTEVDSSAFPTAYPVRDSRKADFQKGVFSRLPKKSLHPRSPNVFGSFWTLESIQPVARLRRRAALCLSTDLPVVTAERGEPESAAAPQNRVALVTAQLPLSRGGSPVP